MADTKKKGIYEKLMEVQQTLKAPKNQYNSFGKYKYRSCEDILEGLKEPLSKVKAAVTINDEMVCIGERVYVRATATFIDAETGEKVENSAYAQEPNDRKGMDASQVTGATSSYARKYALNGLFLIDDNKDADTDESKTEKDARKKQSEKKTDKTPSERDMQAIESLKISEIKQNLLKKQCEDSGINPVIVLDKLAVGSFSEITEKQFSWLRQNWSKEIVGAVQS